MKTKVSALFIMSVLWIQSPALAQVEAGGSMTANPVYEKNCAKCHGKTAEGRHFGGQSLVSESTKGMSSEELRNIITNGKGRMPKYAGKLSAEEINALVEQLKAFNRK